MTWTTFTLETTTPLFNGGAAGAEDLDVGIRVPSIRGAMRFWFRALAGTVTGRDLGLLAELESAVFGRPAASQGDQEAGSSVIMRVGKVRRIHEPYPDFMGNAANGHRDEGRSAALNKWIGYLLGPSLATYSSEHRRMELSRPFLPPGITFDLKLRFSCGEDQAALALAALWLMCAYGGVGARTRRGFGGLRILHASGALPTPWDISSILTPELAYYDDLPRYLPAIDSVRETLEQFAGSSPTGPPAGLALFPVLGPEHTMAGVSGGQAFDSWEDVAFHAGEQLRSFRASEEAPGVRYSPKLKTPEWRTTVWGGDDHFPVGALGLPIIFKGPRQSGGPVTVEAVLKRDASAEPLRRASPLWLRPVGSGDRWRLLSYTFLAQFLPQGADVTLRRRREEPKQLRLDDEDVRQLTKQWIDTMTNDDQFAPGDRQRRDRETPG